MNNFITFLATCEKIYNCTQLYSVCCVLFPLTSESIHSCFTRTAVYFTFYHVYYDSSGNEGSAFVEVLVGRSCAPEDYQVLTVCMVLCLPDFRLLQLITLLFAI